jgi:polar amino acid transport system substrate-binding protein
MTKLINTSRAVLAALCATIALGCGKDSPTGLAALATQEFGVPTGTVADELVRTKFPNARFRYYPTIGDAALAVKRGEVAAAAYDEPILRNIAAKDGSLRVLPERITTDEYGFAVRQGDAALREAFDAVVRDAKASGDYQRMLDRWLPASGAPGEMPVIPAGTGAPLRFGTAPVTEPFSFRNAANAVVGLDVELAARVAARLGRRLEIVVMPFGELIPAVAAGQVDMIGACITITDARKQVVLFSASYYTGGISALVRK